MEHIKVKLFNRTKYEANVRKLESRNAPNYVLNAFNMGYVKVVNEYYKQRLNAKRGLTEAITSKDMEELKQFVEKSGSIMIQEAYKKKDIDFLKLMYQMTNIDILTKHKKVPANAGQLIKQGEILDMGLTKLHKKLR